RAQVPVEGLTKVSDVAEEGTILQQHPPTGETDTLAAEGASLLVSRGPGNREYVMPDLIGRPALTVLETLRAAGLKVTEVRYRAYPGAPAGLVLRQAPLSGYSVNTQTAISLDDSLCGR